MMLPAASARLWARELPAMLVIALAIALVSAYVGLLLSYHGNLPSGPAIILTAGIAYFASLAFGRHGGLMSRWLRGRHLEA
jgi:zinc/manganese transport system permease protein